VEWSENNGEDVVYLVLIRGLKIVRESNFIKTIIIVK
jgi:hypothetical protein